MKNPRMESLRRSMLAYQRRSNGDQFDGGIVFRHLYPEESQAALSWWDDFTLTHGKCRIAVCWTHPRMAYEDRIGEEARAACSHLCAKDDMFADSVPNYKRIGRSRKKIVSFTTERLGNDAWFNAIRAEELRLSREASYTISPSLDVTWTAYGRLVSLCAPVEVRNTEELRSLAKLVRRLLKGETTLAAAFPDYAYTQKDWVADGLADKAAGLHAMQVAG